MRREWATWTGTILTACMSLLVALIGGTSDLPRWIVYLAVIGTAVGAVVQMPLWWRDESPGNPPIPQRPQRVTFKGSFDHSDISDVHSEADSVIDGTARRSRIRDVRHRPKG